MYNISSDYLTAINAASRQVSPLLEMYFNDDITATTSTSDSSDASSIVRGAYRPIANPAVGSISIPATQGWRATATSASDGTIASQTVTVTYASTVTSQYIWLIGRLSNYPVNFLVEMKVAGTWSTVANVTGNTSWYWFTTLSSPTNIDAVRLTVTKISTGNDKLLVYAFGLINKVIFTNNDLATASLLAEANSESHNPIGTITSNELDFELNNEEGWFTTTNSGIFSLLIKPGIKVRMHTGVLLPNGNVEYAPWGTFYVTDWKAPSANITASVVANDRLLKLMARPAQNKLPIMNATVAGLFRTLFNSLGLVETTDYVIDDSLTMAVAVGWMGNGTVGDAMQSYTTAGLCAVFVGSDDIIYVKDLYKANVDVATLTASDQILNFDNTQDFTSIYTSVKVTYKTPRLADESELVNIPNASIPSGTSTLTIPFDSPVGNITNISVDGVSTVTGISYGTNSVDVTLNNSGATENATISIYGRIISGDGATVVYTEPTLYAEWPDKSLEIQSDYIQSYSAADDHAGKLIRLASDPQAYYNVSIRGLPGLDVLDSITIQQSNSLKTVTNIDAVVLRNRLTFDGSLTGELLLRKPLSSKWSDVANTTWSSISSTAWANL